MNKNNIGRLFKVAREAQDKTQEEIASGIIARSSLSSFEAGNFVLSDDILMKLAPRLNLNQAFIGGQSSSPFKSKDVIKLFTKEIMAFHSLEPLYTILEFYKKLELIFLVAEPKYSNTIRRFFDHNLSQKPMYAIVARTKAEDEDDTIFIFRRRNPKSTITLAADWTQALTRIANLSEENRVNMTFSQLQLDNELFEKIKRWQVRKKDIEPLFDEVEFSTYDKKNDSQLKEYGIDVLSGAELSLIKESRKWRENHNISTDDLFALIETIISRKINIKEEIIRLKKSRG
ncbi:MAG: helix-turn-helix transcriptional regulator [Smithella sp.]|jgi:transcriptional regulator with XRE-family HTH domain